MVVLVCLIAAIVFGGLAILIVYLTTKYTMAAENAAQQSTFKKNLVFVIYTVAMIFAILACGFFQAIFFTKDEGCHYVSNKYRQSCNMAKPFVKLAKYLLNEQ